MITFLRELKARTIRNKIVCYGHFSYLHAGHIRYFNYASSTGRAICVAITNGPNEQSDTSFSIDERISLLKKITDVCQFVVCESYSLLDFIDTLESCDLVLGKSSLVHSNLSEDHLRHLLQAVNSRLILLEGDEGKYSDLFFNSTDDISLRHIDEFRFRCSNSSININDITNALQVKPVSKVLVIGDLIVDEYVATEPLGISAEAPVIVVREVQSRKYVGGAGVVAKHLAVLGVDVSILGVVGADNHADYIKQNLLEYGVQDTFVLDNTRPTTYKRRYISGYTKLLRVSRISKFSLSSHIEQQLINKLDQLVHTCDVVVVSDFQYGVLSKNVSDHLEHLASKYNKKVFVDVQCSSQSGKINKLHSSYAVFPTEKEARITTAEPQVDVEHLGPEIIRMCNSRYCILKLGEEGLILFERDSQTRFQLPALSVNAIDVAGAGDSLLASVVYGHLCNLTMNQCVVLGSIVASLNVENLGNEPVSTEKILTRIKSIF